MLNWAPPTYQIRRVSHGSICNSYEVSCHSYRGKVIAEHTGIELVRPRSRKMEFEFRARRYPLSSRECLVFNGRETHSDLYDGSPGATNVQALIFQPEFVTSLLEDLGADGNELVFESALTSFTGDLARDVTELFNLSRIGGISPLSYEVLATQIATRLLESSPHSLSDRLSRAAREGRFPSAYLRVKKALAERIGSPEASLAEISREVGMSKFHLVRNFKRNTGYSPMQYLRVLRVDRATGLLASGRDSVGEISGKVGVSAPTLNRIFRRELGMSPSRFRRSI